MKLIELFDGTKVSINNQEDRFINAIKKNEKPVNILAVNDRLKQVAYDLYLRNIILIDDDGLMTINEKDNREAIIW